MEEVLRDREDLGYHLYSVLEDDTLVRGMQHLLDASDDMAGKRQLRPDSKFAIGIITKLRLLGSPRRETFYYLHCNLHGLGPVIRCIIGTEVIRCA